MSRSGILTGIPPVKYFKYEYRKVATKCFFQPVKLVSLLYIVAVPQARLRYAMGVNMKKRKNIVIINPDQMRADSMAHFGNPASFTPNLDRLAMEGASFSNAFCQNPVCTPSRCSFMSGWYPHVAGHRTMTHMMRSHEPVLLKYLKEDGYHVWMNQRNDLLPAQQEEYYKDYCNTYYIPSQKPDKLPAGNWRGEPDGDNYYSFFRGIIPEGKTIDDLWTTGAADFIRNYNQDEPFCIFLPLMLPHPDYQISQKYYDRINISRLPGRIKPPKDFTGKARIEKELSKLQRISGWEEERFDELRAVYLAMCSKVDELTGMIVQALKEKNVYDDTAIFVFSDHGDFTGDYGLVEKAQNCFEDCLTNVPFIVKLPKGMQKVTGNCDTLVELIDFYATAEDLSGIKKRHTHFGKSLLPYLAEKEEKVRDAVFCEGGIRKGEEHCKESGGQGIPNPERLYYPRQSLQYSDDMYNGKAIMCRTKEYKYIKRLYESDEFYDLRKDPSEINNRITDPSYREIILQLKERLLEHYINTCDVVPFEKDLRMDKSFMELLHPDS